ncbi:MAG: hypothetical protein AAF509_15050 [Pseudomonadota bacterium]
MARYTRKLNKNRRGVGSVRIASLELQTGAFSAHRKHHPAPFKEAENAPETQIIKFGPLNATMLRKTLPQGKDLKRFGC